ncbi:unnamed protein product, partial [Symbiodinium pilosum]
MSGPGQQTRIVLVPCRRKGSSSSQWSDYSDDYSDSSSSASEEGFQPSTAASIWDADAQVAPPPGIWDGGGGDCKAGKLCKPVPNDAAPVRLRPGPVNLREGGVLRKDRWRRLPDGPLESFLEMEAATTDACRQGPGGRRAAASWADDNVGKRRKRPLSASPSRAIKISNVPPSVSLKHLRELFQKGAGQVVDGAQGEHGDAWLKFQRSHEAEKAVELFSDGTLDGRTIK